jgi:hypothetical protein
MGCPGIVSGAVEQAATTAAELTRRKMQPEQQDRVYHAIIGFCTTLSTTGKYLGDGRELAIQLSGLVVGGTKMSDALTEVQQSAERAQRKVPKE